MHVPSQFVEILAVLEIALPSFFELVKPELRIAPGSSRPRTALVMVPKASMHEDYGLVPGKHYVGSSGKILANHTETVAHSVELASNLSFRPGITASNKSHVSTSLLGAKMVHLFLLIRNYCRGG